MAQKTVGDWIFIGVSGAIIIFVGLALALLIGYVVGSTVDHFTGANVTPVYMFAGLVGVTVFLYIGHQPSTDSFAAKVRRALFNSAAMLAAAPLGALVAGVLVPTLVDEFLAMVQYDGTLLMLSIYSMLVTIPMNFAVLTMLWGISAANPKQEENKAKTKALLRKIVGE